MDLRATYEREIIRKPENLAKFYVVLATLTVVLFLFFGIRPLALTATQNSTLLSELQDIRDSLTLKIEKIDSESEKVSQLSSQIDLLYKKVPQNPMLESYLSELVLDAAQSGFAIQRFRQQEENSRGELSLELEFTGNINSLPDLVSGVESTDRFVTVESVRTEAKDGFTEVRMNVVVYSL